MKRVKILITSIVLTTTSNAEEIGLRTSLDLESIYGTNIFKRSIDEISDTNFSAKPLIEYVGLYGKHKIEARYDGKFSKYNKTNSANYNNHHILSKGTFSLTRSIDSEIKLEYSEDIEIPGLNNASLINTNAFNEYKETKVSPSVRIGKSESIGQIIINYTYFEQDFTNNQQDFRDVSGNELNGKFLYRLGNKTRLIFDYTAKNLNYDNTSRINLTNDQKNYMTGLEWNFSATTKSHASIGYQQVSYRSEQINDLSGLSYDLDLNWQPNTYSLITVSGKRSARESALDNSGGYIGTDLKLIGKHDISEKLKLELNYEFSNISYNGNEERTDKVNKGTLGFTYDMNRLITLYTWASLIRRKSENNFFEFEAKEISIGIMITP